MKHQVRNFSSLLGKLEGFSDVQLEAHLKLYEGYVAKLNEIEGSLLETDPEKSNYSFGEFSELKRREAVAFNGVYLHELYFENLSERGKKPSAALCKKIDADFGSMAKLEHDLKGCALSTPGWVVLTHNRIDRKLHTYVLYEHHIGFPIHQEILLALDCWEHAYLLDYGIAKMDYVEAFFRVVDWEAVSERGKLL